MRWHLVDTFADATHRGNPAGVVVVREFPPFGVMQEAARVIGQPTTAFVAGTPEPGTYRIRWFTPHKQLNLCGHATIATARHLFGRPADAGRRRLRFESEYDSVRTVLHAERVGELVRIDLPAASLTPAVPPVGLLAALRVENVRGCVVSSDDVLVELPSITAVLDVRPDFAALARQPFRGHIVTARDGDETDFVSRTFFPALGVDEDQVCVTAHCKLAPYWAGRLDRPSLTARQLSRRGGRLDVELAARRVRVSGSARPVGTREVDVDGCRRSVLAHPPEPAAPGRAADGATRGR